MTCPDNSTPLPPVRLIFVPWLIPGWATAQAWPNRILIRRGVEVTEHLLAHELVHIQQWRELGIFKFIYTYITYYLQYGYADHPLELEARTAACRNHFRQWARQLLLSQNRS